MSLIYRGTSSDDVHFNVTERRVYNAPAFDVTGIEVPGRSGDILNSQERFKNKAVVYTGFIRSSDFPGDTTWERLSRGLRTIKAWVCGDAGKYHDLTDDYDPGFVRRAFVSGETAISEVLDRPDGATITITFMAAPFMYEESDPIELPETGTASGAIASFEGVAAPLQSLKFSIEPSQSGSGDPSPSNIRPISGWSQVDGAQSGKNLCAAGLISGQIGSTGGYAANSARICNGVLVGPYYLSDTYLRPGTYTLSIDGLDQCTLLTKDASYNVLDNFATSWHSLPFTFTLTRAGYVLFTGRTSNSTTIDPANFKAQIDLGSTATPYTAPTITPITIVLGQTVYGGTVDALAGKLLSDWLDKDMGTLSWVKSGTRFYAAFAQTAADCPEETSVTGVTRAVCSQYKAWDRNAIESQDSAFSIHLSGTLVYLTVVDSRYSDAATFKTAMNGVYVCYPLRNALAEVDLTAVSVNSLLGQNNVWCNTGDTEVVYVEPTENPTEWPSKPRLEITMAGAGTLTVNGKTWSIGAYTGTLICDSEIMDWYDASNLKNSLVSGDGFPELQPGENVITYTGGITKVVAKPRWRTL